MENSVELWHLLETMGLNGRVKNAVSWQGHLVSTKFDGPEINGRAA